MNILELTSWLFVPATQAKYVRSAVESEASAFILDLEDSVPEARKAEARDALPQMVEALRAADRPIFVRVNRGQEADIHACAKLGLEGLVLPKAETAEEITAAVEFFASFGGANTTVFIPAIESAAGVLNAAALAGSSGRVAGLMFGTGDFVAETGFAMDAVALSTPAALIALGAKVHGKAAFGLPQSIAEMQDLEALRSWGERARTLGYSGSPIIHPKQVEAMALAFQPSAQEVAFATSVVAAFEASGGGATTLNGRLLERPVFLQAQATLSRAGGYSAQK